MHLYVATPLAVLGTFENLTDELEAMPFHAVHSMRHLTTQWMAWGDSLELVCERITIGEFPDFAKAAGYLSRVQTVMARARPLRCIVDYEREVGDCVGRN